MKNILIAFLFMPVLALAQKGFSISGIVAGVADGEVKIVSVQEANQVVATGEIRDGRVSIRGSVPEPYLYLLIIGNEKPVNFFLENAEMKIEGTRGDFLSLRVEGSPANRDFNDFQEIFNPLFGSLNSVAARIQELHGQGRQEPSLMTVYDSITKQIDRQIGSFVAAKKSSFVSLFALWVTAELFRDPIRLEERYLMLADDIRNSKNGTNLNDFIQYHKVGAIGTMALDFTQDDISGKPVSLSSFRGKYVLVDFWASWCKPCRVENPNVVKAYNKFRDKNFTILGVSLDQDRDAWLRAVEKDKLTWTNVSDLGFWNNKAAQLYHVSSIPQNLLIDPSGKIIAKDLRGEDLEKKLCELLGCN